VTSVRARSLGSTGRPGFGRPVAALVAALIATFAIGVPAALAGETPGPGGTAADVQPTPATPPAVPAPVDPPPVKAPPAKNSPGDPPPAEAPPADPPAEHPPPAEPPPGDPPPAEPSPADPLPVEPAPVDPPTAESPQVQPPFEHPPSTDQPPAQSSPLDAPPAQTAPVQPAPATGGNHSAAQNRSRVIQAVWQVQRGCRTRCHGTSQKQRSVQVSDTTQRATAISGESDGGSSAQARNESSTIQFVWQMQIGCVAFCFHTSQSQEASQQSYTTQEADAQSALTVWAENLAETVQYVFQIQQGCEHECHGVTQHQSSTQGQTTSQSATADALGEGDGFFSVPDWLVAYAETIGATIQVIYQYEEALCLEECTGDAQLQEAMQHAVTDQRAVAVAAPPEPAEPPTGGEPPGGEPPRTEPPAGEPAPGPTDPTVLPETEAPAPPARAAPDLDAPDLDAPDLDAPSLAASSSVRQVLVLGRHRRRTVRRQQLVLRVAPRGGAPATGGVRMAPVGPAAAAVPAAPAGPAPRSVSGSASGSATTPVRTASDDDPRHARSAGDQRPAQTFAVPSPSTDGGSMGWLLIPLLTAAVAAATAALRRGLATTMTRI
jgi:hypothetical protein